MRIQFIILLFLPIAIYSQPAQPGETNPIDSLKVKLSQASYDSTRANLLLRIAAAYTVSNPDSSLYYGRQAIQLAGKIGNKKIAVNVMGYMGDAYHSKGNLPKALEISLESISVAEGLSPDIISRLGPTHSTLGDIYTAIGDYPQALAYYSKLLVFSNLSSAYGHFGRAGVYEQMGMLDSTMIELEASYKNFIASERHIEDYRVPPKWYNLRAKVYARQGQFDLALRDYFTALNMTVRSNNSYYTSNSYNDIAGFYANINEADSSIYYAMKGLEEASKISYVGGMLAASEILAFQFEGKDDSKALSYLKLANSTRNQLYGAGNIQVMKDMISQNERKQQEATIAEAAYQSKLRINGLLGFAFVLVIATVFLIRNNRTKKKANQVIQKAYLDLKNTQAQLIQSEKMASLGELTAGIAHEIQNPLNFVNNFSEVNTELIEELKAERSKLKGERDEKLEEEILNDLKENEEKINHHGKRADAIVKGMLQHSQTSSGQKELIDINALADEYLRLAYHGLRAKDKSFNSDFNLELDKNLPKIKVIPQDIGRVLLNLINNAFYTVDKKTKHPMPEASDIKATDDNTYKPNVTVFTKTTKSPSGDLGVMIKVKDNGEGIPEQVRAKIFQPFFTTKPTGSGTGLGLSLSYDIVKAHGGELKVVSKEGEGAKFILKIPNT